MATGGSLTLEDMQKLASQHGGECLSDKYINRRTKLRWKCSVGHEWEAAPRSVVPSGNKDGTWCRLCGEENARLGLRNMQQLADEHAGYCLSFKYVGYAMRSVFLGASLPSCLHWRKCKRLLLQMTDTVSQLSISTPARLCDGCARKGIHGRLPLTMLSIAARGALTACITR